MASSNELSDHVEAEDAADPEHDSTYDGDSINGFLTTTIKSSILDYRQLYGRTYHAYREEQYVFPNDEPELQRLDLQHHMCVISNRDKLFLAPISDAPRNVLDVGTGTGIWAIEFADQVAHPVILGAA